MPENLLDLPEIASAYSRVDTYRMGDLLYGRYNTHRIVGITEKGVMSPNQQLCDNLLLCKATLPSQCRECELQGRAQKIGCQLPLT